MKNFIMLVAMSIYFLPVAATAGNYRLVLSSNSHNDLCQLLTQCGISFVQTATPLEAVTQAKKGDAVIITASGYPVTRTPLTQEFFNIAGQKKLRLYIEYPDYLPDIKMPTDTLKGKWERGVVSSSFFGKQLPPMSLLGLNGVHLIPLKDDKPLLVFAKVAGFDVATYGLAGTDVYPLLFQRGNMLVATTCLTNFKTARYGPNDSWHKVWTRLLTWLTGDKSIALDKWQSDPCPMYVQDDTLPPEASKNAVGKSAEWIYNARLLIHPSWLHQAFNNQGNAFIASPVGDDKLIGDGLLGVLEGHASEVNYDGTQQYRYWLRCDVQGEVAFLLTSAAQFDNNEKYLHTAENLLDYIFFISEFRQGPRNCRDSSAYGLLSWGAGTAINVYFGDDNARAILGAIGASSMMNNQRWNRFIVENILANLRISGKNGFNGRRLEQPQLQEKGWKYFAERDIVNPHPHFESWMWACYLWLYDKTREPLLLEKAKTAIKLTMEAYPDKWEWTNGIQQERTRMILPLAWLVRVEDTPLHREWLDLMVQEVLKNQQASGAIREELGSSNKGMYGGPGSNAAYGTNEAALIARNGDPVSDMLYTSNFGVFALNEAACATNNPEYRQAVNKMTDFLTRIQLHSSHLDLDGAWFRAFDYKRWDYWASNADAGWGAWGTLAGWTQTWITATLMLHENQTSYWEITKNMDMQNDLKQSLWMLEN